MSGSSNFQFWLKRILVMLAVIAGAVAFLIFKPEENTASSDTSVSKPKSNSLQESVSRFYSEFRLSSRDPIKEKYGDYVVPIEKSSAPIEAQIQAVTKVNFPPLDNWEGDYKQRAFGEGSTLKAEAEQHAINNGMTLIWDLDQDFVIKKRFVSENSVAGMLYEIAGAIDANFPADLKVYFCGKKRTLVITDNVTEYLQVNCQVYEGS
ncbi:TcpQ domain-containing protein [Agaribacter flavus]|uniref:TcpQ domain-containing protein n=1 Tax=Agaribacter flavus TaxID=1902781 RepID=A0ABV7FM64_9ALTE